MTSLTASEARIPREVFDQVRHGGERVRITRYSDEVYLIPKADMELLRALENLSDGMQAQEILARINSGQEKTIPWVEAKKALGL